MDLGWMEKWADRGRLYTDRPYALTINGEMWNVVTNGKLLAAVKGLPQFTAPNTSADIEKLSGSFGKILVPVGEPVPVDLRALREWVAVAPCEECDGGGRVPCDECQGDAESACICPNCGDEHAAECEHCEDGKAWCDCQDPRYGFIGGQGVNRRYLEPLLNLPGATASLYVGASDPLPGRPHLFVGDGWELAVMPVREPGKDAPVFALSAGVSVSSAADGAPPGAAP